MSSAPARTAQAAHTQGRTAAPPIRPAPKAKVTRAPLAAAARTVAGKETRTRARDVRVKRGETLYAISRRQGVPLRALIDSNGLTPPYRLAAGTRLHIPAMRVYRVGTGDTVYGLARRYNVNPGWLIRENRIKTAEYRLYPGQKLIVPRNSRGTGAHPVIRAAVQTPVAEAGARAKAPRRRSDVAAAWEAPLPPAVVRSRPSGQRRLMPPPRAGEFEWPVRGKVLSAYGAKGGGLYNDGINIAARAGAPVRATESGVVAYIGNELRGYGNLLLVRHSGGWVSAYAHTRKILVTKGQIVHRGQTIARVGRSGGVNTPQLHFELRHGPRAVDPLRYLGKRS